MSKKEKGEKKKGCFGAFFGGGFIGFNLCLALIAGLGAFVYFKVSPNWINRNFKTQIDLGSENVNNMTVKDFVSSALSLVQNLDTYKLGSLERDFGIKIENKMFGIDISDLKEVEISKLSEAVEKKFANISAGELKNISGMNIEDNMGTILDKNNTYYYNNYKLYRKYDNYSYSDEVDFEYTISSDETKVSIKNKSYSIVSNKVKVVLWDLPLTAAFGDFMKSMGDNMTLSDLEKDFGVKLPSFMDNVDKANTTVNKLEDAINGLYVADFLGYTIDKTDPDNIVVKDGANIVTGVLSKLSQNKIEDLEECINDLRLTDLFAEDEMTGVLTLIDNPEKVTLTGQTDPSKGLLSISDALTKVIEEKNLGELVDAGLIIYNGFDDMRLKWIDLDLSLGGTNYVQVEKLTLDQLVEISLTILDGGGLLLENKPV